MPFVEPVYAIAWWIWVLLVLAIAAAVVSWVSNQSVQNLNPANRAARRTAQNALEAKLKEIKEKNDPTVSPEDCAALRQLIRDARAHGVPSSNVNPAEAFAEAACP